MLHIPWLQSREFNTKHGRNYGRKRGPCFVGNRMGVKHTLVNCEEIPSGREKKSHFRKLGRL